MEGGRIEARRDAGVSAVAEDEFQWGRRLGDMMNHDGLQRTGTDTDGQEGGRLNSGGKVGRCVLAAS